MPGLLKGPEPDPELAWYVVEEVNVYWCEQCRGPLPEPRQPHTPCTGPEQRPWLAVWFAGLQELARKGTPVFVLDRQFPGSRESLADVMRN